jgi:hypothetical protein
LSSFLYRTVLAEDSSRVRHVTFDRLLLAYRDGWRAFFNDVGQGLSARVMLLRTMQVDFERPVVSGNVTICIFVRRIGGTSAVLEFNTFQGEILCGFFVGTFVKSEVDSGVASEFTADQSRALGHYVAGEAEE